MTLLMNPEHEITDMLPVNDETDFTDIQISVICFVAATRKDGYGGFLNNERHNRGKYDNVSATKIINI